MEDWRRVDRQMMEEEVRRIVSGNVDFRDSIS
jgi:hypothetical protein